MRALQQDEEDIIINLRMAPPVAPPVEDRPLKQGVRVKKFLEKKVWDRMEEAEKECPICYDLVRNFNEFCLLRCGHSFHVKCFEKYERKDECPFCRSGL